MDVVEEREFEDTDGTKVYRKIGVGKDKFLEEVTHLVPSQAFIDNVIKPRNLVSKRYRDKEEKAAKMQKKYKEWYEKKFGGN
ncbi:hypothetical protein LCGC14_0611270 [marine sediment metagenome]|uniref:Uncharacterized protein n=1 Tax=marine sediment metagenome TaxID=412755 RepID=A0A0F9R7N6_9ZZZZ